MKKKDNLWLKYTMVKITFPFVMFGVIIALLNCMIKSQVDPSYKMYSWILAAIACVCIVGTWLYLRTLKCPKCDLPIGGNGNYFGFLSPKIDKKECKSCGHDLSKGLKHESSHH